MKKTMAIPVKDWPKFVKGVKWKNIGLVTAMAGIVTAAVGVIISSEADTFCRDQIPIDDADMDDWKEKFEKEWAPDRIEF